jgi:DNA-binding CsgD family transcriptional regulator
MSNFLFSLWQRVLRDLGLRSTTRQVQLYKLDDSLIQSLQELAVREQRSEDEVASDLLSYALLQRDAAETNLAYWRSLSPREQQVAAMACLGYTNRQIAGRLMISHETVKTHMKHVLRKFGLHSKIELQQALANWDFSAWLEP